MLGVPFLHAHVCVLLLCCSCTMLAASVTCGGMHGAGLLLSWWQQQV
jgi:hypothetical protein